MSEFSQHMPPEQEDQLQQLEQQLLDAAAEVEQAAQSIGSNRRGGATRPEGPPEGNSHDGVITASAEHTVEYSGEAPVVTTRQRGGAHRPQGPATAAGVLGGRFAEIQQTEYKNGVKHVYGIDENGKKQHLSFGSILEAYGHAGDTQGKRSESVQNTDRVTQDQLDQNEAAEFRRRAEQNANQASAETDTYEKYESYDEKALAHAAREANAIGNEELRDALQQMATDRMAKHVVNGELTQEEYNELKGSLDAFIQTQAEEPGADVPTEAAVNASESGSEARESAIREQYSGYDERGLVNAARQAHAESNDELRDVLEKMASEQLDGWVADDKMTIEQQAQLKRDFADYIRGEEVTRPNEAVSEPITDPSEQGMKARVGRIWGKVKDATLYRTILAGNDASAAVANRLTTTEEQERSKRRGIYAGVAVGALILGSYVALKYGSDIVDGARDMFDGKKSPSPENIPDKKQGRPANGNEFNFARKTMNVRPGEGFEDSLQHQYGLTDAESHKLYGKLKPELQGSAGTYLQGSEIRISNAGAFHYNEEQRRIIEEFIKNKN